MFVPRPDADTTLRQALARAPAVALLGTRQVGKTTLARNIARETPGSLYLDLESSADLRRLEDPGRFLRAQAGHLTIIDEVHRAPLLFAELRGIIDERRTAGERAGQFLLLGSASLDLVQKASEMLAGRIVYLEMAPIGAADAGASGIADDALWLRGGFPQSLVAASDEDSFLWRRDFLRSYLERDVPMFAPRLPAATVGRLWTMLANGQGSLLNQARLAQGLAISAPSVERYIDLLCDLLLVRRLPPWSGNLGKRLIRTPKVYVRDSGLVHALLEIGPLNQLLGHPVAGPSWEGFVIENLIAAAGAGRSALFYRSQDGAEIDLLFERAGRPDIAVEIKRSSAPKIEAGFSIACRDLGVRHRLVVAPVSLNYPAKGDVQVHSLQSAMAFLKADLGSPFPG